VASGAGVRRLVLTHFYPETEGEDLLEPASRHFSGEVTAAFDGLEVEV
jgi:ribonuclease BN (tRNA processing enzyme)